MGEAKQMQEKADLEDMFLLAMQILSVLRKGGITEQLQCKL